MIYLDRLNLFKNLNVTSSAVEKSQIKDNYE